MKRYHDMLRNNRLVAFHHAGIVRSVDNGNITSIVHFDPMFDRPDEPITPQLAWKAATEGMMGTPRECTGADLERIFPACDLIRQPVCALVLHSHLYNIAPKTAYPQCDTPFIIHHAHRLIVL